MSNQLLKKIADELKEARKKKKVSIDQIFTKTRIDKKYLEAIEDGNFSIMPDVYIRAFIKEFAINVGLNPSEILEKYSLAQKGVDFERDKEEEHINEKSIKKPQKEKNIKNNKIVDSISDIPETTSNTTSDKNFSKSYYYILVAILMLVFIFVIYKLFLTESSNEIITEKPFEEIVQNQNITQSDNEKNIDNKSNNFEEIEQKDFELIKPQNQNIQSSDNSKEEYSTQAGLNLRIIGNGKSWIRVVADEKDNSEFIIEDGITKELKASEKFYLHIGNSGALKLLLNNKDLFFSGSEGKVRKIFVTKDGIEYLRRTPTFNGQQ